MQHKFIAFIGAGNMTRSIISGMVSQGYPANKIIASNPSTPKLDALSKEFGIVTTTNNCQAIEQAEVVVLAVKPQVMELACQQFNHLPLQDKVFISIAAGLPISRLQDFLGAPLPIIRTMPNTPSAIGLGMTGLYSPASVSQEYRQYAGDLLSMVGKVLWLDKEADIDAVIAAAGSSPAYFFYILESMQTISQQYGFSRDNARLLVEQAMLGAAQLVVDNPDSSLSELRQQVTSKGGATAEAIKVFEQQQMASILKQGMDAAISRSQTLSKQL